MESENDYYIISVENDQESVQNTVEIYDYGDYNLESGVIDEQNISIINDFLPQCPPNEDDYYLIVAKSDTDLPVAANSDISSIEYSEDSVGDEEKKLVANRTPFLQQFANETTRKQLEECVKKMMMASRRLPKIDDTPYKMSGHLYRCKFCNFSSECHRKNVKHYRFAHGPRHYRCLACAKSYRRHLTLRKHEMVCTNPQSEVVRKARELILSHRTRSNDIQSEEE